jgi:hypothetical protein
VWVNLIVVGDPRRQRAHDGLCIGTWTDADVAALDSADEGSAIPVLCTVSCADRAEAVMNGAGVTSTR